MNRRILGIVFGLSLMVLVLFGTILPRTALGGQASLNVNPGEASIPLGSTQQFEALFTDAQGTTAPANGSIPDAFSYALFSGSLTSTLSINGGNETIIGSSHSNYNFKANGANLKITETCEAVGTVDVNDNESQIKNIVQNASHIDMPDFSETIKIQADTAGQTYNGDKTFDGGNINVESSIYVIGNLTINGGRFSGKGTIVATGDIKFNGSNLYLTNDDSICFYSKSGDITINGANANIDGMLYAPNGTITLNGANQTINGRVVGNSVKIDGAGLNIISSDKDLDSLPQVKWSSSNLSVASISPTGVATGNGLGTCTITATYTINNDTYRASSQLTIVSLAVTPAAATISLGMTQQYKAEFTDSDGNVTDVTNLQPQSSLVSWSSDNINVATIDPSSGLATSSGVGTCTITGTYINNEVRIEAKTSLTIVLPTLSVTLFRTTVSTGDDICFSAILTDYAGNSNDVTSSVTWSSHPFDFSLASVIFNVNEVGVVTATAYGVGNCTITAMDPISKAFGTATLIIIMPTISITPTSQNILSGSTQEYQAIMTYSVGNTRDVTTTADWLSDNTSVATVDKGVATGGNVAGNCMITVIDKKSEASNSATLTVIAPTLLRLVLANTAPLAIGGNIQVTATLVYPENSTKDVTNSKLVTWNIDNSNVATVNSSGRATGVGGGQCTITATDSGSGLSGTVNLTVLPNLIIGPSSTIIPIGFKQQYNAQLVYADGRVAQDVTGGVTWTSSDPEIAMIDPTGLATGIAEGSSTITASGSHTPANLTVKNVRTFNITPAIDTIFVGYKQQFKLQFSDTISDVLTNSASWTSSNESVATIVDAGLVSGIKAGTSKITATVIINGESLTKSFRLTVLPPKGGIIREWEQ